MKAAATLVATVFLAGGGFAHASDLSLTINGSCFHSDRTTSYNEVNPGLGIAKSVSPDVTAEIGFYKNSYSQHTSYATASWMPLQAGIVKAGLMAGVATGYQEHTGYKLSPIGGLKMSVQFSQHAAVVVHFVPPAPSKAKPTSVTTFSLSVSL